ncbi:MAG: hypothetical protein ACYC0V_21360 [Armatimonadota bacterium]
MDDQQNLDAKCFSHPDALKSVSLEWFIQFLAPHAVYLESRGLKLPDSDWDECLFDYYGLMNILMTQDANMPRDLIDSLYCVHEMATPEGMDCLLDEAQAQGIVISDTQSSPFDVAIQLWLRDKNALMRRHAEHFMLDRPSTFIYFQVGQALSTFCRELCPDIIRALEKDMDEWFQIRQRGQGCHVFYHTHNNGLWFVVEHGGLFKREGCIQNGESSCIFCRPEIHDLVVYVSSKGELRIHASSRTETEIYRTLFGRHLFGDDHHFPVTEKYTLEPLKTLGRKSLVCSDIDGMESVRLIELEYVRDGIFSDCEIHRSSDVFAAFEARREIIPPEAHITKACFLVKFTDSCVPRVVTIRPLNVAKYCREYDYEPVDMWLRMRGFILNAGYGNENTRKSMANV